MKKKLAIAQFLEAAIADGADECLFWPFVRHSKGYGRAYIGGRNIYAHRYICEKCWGPAPADKPLATHSCGRGAEGCIAPHHLKWGSAADNSADMIAHGHSGRGRIPSSAKLDAESARAIRNASGSYRTIARRFGVHSSTVSRIKTGEAWREST
jgi:hypothetical protein